MQPNRKLSQKFVIIYQPASYQVSDLQTQPVGRCPLAGSRSATRQVLELEAG